MKSNLNSIFIFSHFHMFRHVFQKIIFVKVESAMQASLFISGEQIPQRGLVSSKNKSCCLLAACLVQYEFPLWTSHENVGRSDVTNGVLTTDETDVFDMSEVADNPTYVVVTSSRLILEENLNFCLLKLYIGKY